VDVSNVALQFFLGTKDIVFVPCSLTRPHDGVLPLEVAEPLLGRREEGVTMPAPWKEAYVWLDVFEDVPPGKCSVMEIIKCRK
jgi:hypothetical protein